MVCMHLEGVFCSACRPVINNDLLQKALKQIQDSYPKPATMPRPLEWRIAGLEREVAQLKEQIRQLQGTTATPINPYFENN